VIRPATSEDLAQLAALEAELFADDAWGEPQLGEELSGPGRCFQVNDDEGVVAYVVTMVVGDTADLLRVGVRPDRRQAGAATAMVAAAMLQAKRAGATRMMLEVAADNEPALALYTAAEFAEVDRRRGYYRSGADALVLSRDL
jgi:[ribosomal protein S18]-alanine N-acetyltransferase